MASKREAWLSPLPSDPRPALLASDEPFARFATLTEALRAQHLGPGATAGSAQAARSVTTRVLAGAKLGQRHAVESTGQQGSHQ